MPPPPPSEGKKEQEKKLKLYKAREEAPATGRILKERLEEQKKNLKKFEKSEPVASQKKRNGKNGQMKRNLMSSSRNLEK